MAPSYFPSLVSFVHTIYFSKMELANLFLPIFLLGMPLWFPLNSSKSISNTASFVKLFVMFRLDEMSPSYNP